MLIDTHSHLYWDSFRPDFDEVIKRAVAAGVTTVVNVGVDSEKSAVAAEMENDKIKFYSTIGIHPHEAIKYAANPEESIKNDIDKLEKIYRDNPKKVIGVGECGLDFLFESNPDWIPSDLTIEQSKDLQHKLFRAQIDLAKKLNLPLIVHCRDDRSKNPENIECWNECLEMIKGWKGILHCFSGTVEITQKTLNPDFSNFLVSFAANITYPKNEYLREAAKTLPLEKICLETDCPFLSPQSKRGQRNEPANVLEVAQTLSEIKGVPLEEVANQTSENVKKLFKIA